MMEKVRRTLVGIMATAGMLFGFFVFTMPMALAPEAEAQIAAQSLLFYIFGAAIAACAFDFGRDRK